jgi:hypothetical protein
VKKPEPPACPKIELIDLDRQKPLDAMGPSIDFPQIPEGFEEWDQKQQAEWIVKNWSLAAEAYSVCEGKRTGLVDWINE